MFGRLNQFPARDCGRPDHWSWFTDFVFWKLKEAHDVLWERHKIRQKIDSRLLSYYRCLDLSLEFLNLVGLRWVLRQVVSGFCQRSVGFPSRAGRSLAGDGRSFINSVGISHDIRNIYIYIFIITITCHFPMEGWL